MAADCVLLAEHNVRKWRNAVVLSSTQARQLAAILTEQANAADRGRGAGAMSKDQPDFDALARESLWTRDDWRDAWNASMPEAWPTVVATVRTLRTPPLDAAAMLAKAIAEGVQP